jgi:diacylglycerol kinase family enzyme
MSVVDNWPQLDQREGERRCSADGSVRIESTTDGHVLYDSGRGHSTPWSVAMKDVYAIKLDGSHVMVRSCPRLTSLTPTSRGVSEKPVRDPYARYLPKVPHMLSFSNDTEANEWYQHLLSLTDPLSLQSLFILINPISGRRKGKHMFDRILLPMLTDAGIGYTVHVTSHAGEAFKTVASMDLTGIRGICVIGGDGFFSEVINGLYSRNDSGEGLKIPLGILPAGSTNCLACSIGMRQPLAAAFAIIRGVTKPLDVLKVDLSSDRKSILAVCGVSYGFISEVNTHAGKWRWLFGPSRYTVCGVNTLLRSPMKYHVDCRYIPVVDEDETVCGPDCLRCTRKEEKVAMDGQWVEASSNLNPRRERLGRSGDTSTMSLFSITNLSVRQSASSSVWNPAAHMASGCMDLVMIPALTRWEMIGLFGKFTKNKHATYNKDIFSVVKTKSVEMTVPVEKLPGWEKGIQVAIDGEVHPLQPLRVDCIHALLNIMCV